MIQEQDNYKKGDEYQLIKGLAQELALALLIIPLPDKIKAAPLGQKIKDLLELSREILELDDDDLAKFEFSVSTIAPESYPLTFGLDWRSIYKSLWLGWWLVTWTWDADYFWRIQDLSVEFQPGL